jgi:hypothetical protein
VATKVSNCDVCSLHELVQSFQQSLAVAVTMQSTKVGEAELNSKTHFVIWSL